MSDPFEILGVKYGASTEEVRSAYRRLVKECHPDQYSDPALQKRAQEKLIQLNLAYEEALKTADRRNVGFNSITCEEAKHFAMRLMEQENPESALRQLCRAESKDAEWFFLQGEILMKLRKYQNAHDSYREAVKRDPDNRRYHEGALNAALALKKSNSIGEKLFGWIKKG